METKQVSWPEPPSDIAAAWPEGFPKDGSKEFYILAYEWGKYVCDNISFYLQRELSTIDRYEIVRHAQNVLRQFCMGDYDLMIFEEIEERYLDGLAGYFPQQVFLLLNGTMKDRNQKVRNLFHKLHARAHHDE